jgi:hypothetical protein
MGVRPASAAVWWENIGHFQINYWFAVHPHPAFGDALDGARILYIVPQVTLGTTELNEAMFRCLENQVSFGANRYTRPTAQRAWTSYFVSRKSAHYRDKAAVDQLIASLEQAVVKTKAILDREILKYRTHSDLNRLLRNVQSDVDGVLQRSASVLGHLDEHNTTLDSLSRKVSEVLQSSYFAPTWRALSAPLREMYDRECETQDSPFRLDDRLIDAALNHYDSLGLVLSSTDDGCYVHIPFREHNSTFFMRLSGDVDRTFQTLSNSRPRSDSK